MHWAVDAVVYASRLPLVLSTGRVVGRGRDGRHCLALHESSKIARRRTSVFYAVDSTCLGDLGRLDLVLGDQDEGGGSLPPAFRLMASTPWPVGALRLHRIAGRKAFFADQLERLGSTVSLIASAARRSAWTLPEALLVHSVRITHPSGQPDQLPLRTTRHGRDEARNKLCSSKVAS